MVAITNEDFVLFDSLFRKGVKTNENGTSIFTETIEKLKVLRAVQKAKEEQQEANTSRAASQRAKDTAAVASSLYDFDGSGDSPVPSPNPAVSRRIGASSKGERDSVPPDWTALLRQPRPVVPSRKPDRLLTLSAPSRHSPRTMRSLSNQNL